MEHITSGEETMNILGAHLNGCCGYSEGECDKCALGKMNISKDVSYCDAMYLLSNKFFNDMRKQNGDESEKGYVKSINNEFNKMFQK